MNSTELLILGNVKNRGHSNIYLSNEKTWKLKKVLTSRDQGLKEEKVELFQVTKNKVIILLGSYYDILSNPNILEYTRGASELSKVDSENFPAV